MKYYSRHIGDYNNDCGHLSLIEHGVYVRLMDLYYLKESGIPDDQKYRWLGARSDEERAAVDSVLSEFFVREGDVWVQTRCAREIEAHHARGEMARSNGKFGGRPRKQIENRAETASVSVENPEETDPVFLENPEQTQKKANHKPLTINHINTANAVLCAQERGSNVLELVAAPWWESHPDPTVARLVVMVRGCKRHAAFEPTAEKVEQLVHWARQFAPEDDAILGVVHEFVEQQERAKSRVYRDVLATLKNWIANREGNWRYAARQRAIDLERQRKAAPALTAGDRAQALREGLGVG